MISKKSLIGYCYLFVSIKIFLFFIVSVILTSKSHNIGWYLIGLSFLFNYLYSAFISFQIIYKHKVSSLFVHIYLLFFIVLPFIGTILYHAILSVETDPEMIDEYKNQMQEYKKHECLSYHLNVSNRIFKYNYLILNSPVCVNNEIELIDTAAKHLNIIVELIKKAKKFIHFEYYIIYKGYILNYLLLFLEEKIKEGVEVRMLVDYTMKFSGLTKDIREKIIKAGVKLKFFNPWLNTHAWWHFRDHNKIFIVDNKYALYGSCNISDEYFNIAIKKFPTTEKSLYLTGAIVNSLNILFCAHWNMYDFDNKKQKDNDIKENPKNYLTPHIIRDKYMPMQFISSSALSADKNIKNNLLQLIYEAKTEILIFTPYFFPSKDILNALKISSMSGTKIKILVPKENNFKSIHRTVFNELLLHNIELYEYFGFNHEKITIIDDYIVYFGTYNWDYRSLYLNFESSLLIQSSLFAKKLKDKILPQFENSHKISKEDLRLLKKLIRKYFDTTIKLWKPFL